MASRKPKAAAPATRSQYEKYEIVEIARADLKNATYNPRRITDEARKKLKANIERVGLVEPIVWNRRTGNIVSGHQRVSVLDALHRTKDYRLTVAAVDLDPKTEKEQNLFMNNPNAQGDYDIESLEAMFREGEIDIAAGGFKPVDVMQMFGEDVSAADQPAEVGELLELSEKLHDIKKAKKDMIAKAVQTNGPHFYCVVIFRDNEERAAFMEALGMEDNKYISGDLLRSNLK